MGSLEAVKEADRWPVWEEAVKEADRWPVWEEAIEDIARLC